jgi:glycosyltransferase 2 family protein
MFLLQRQDAVRKPTYLMKDTTHTQTRAGKFTPVGIVFAILGLLMFAYFVRKAGIDEIVSGIRRLGAGFILLIALSGLRHTVRSLAWTKCFEAPYRLRFVDAFKARVMGDALGNIVPLASVAVAEPSKAIFVRDRVPLIPGFAALAVENIFYSFSVVLFIFLGTTTLLLSFPLPKALRYASIGALVGTSFFGLIGYLVIQGEWKFLSGSLTILHDRSIKWSWLEKAIPRLRTIEERIYGFHNRNRSRFLGIFALDICFHVAGVMEVYTTLFFISGVIAPTMLTAFILESVNRVINVVFKFVPLRTGVDEAGTGMLAKVLGFTTAIGVTLAVVRKARDIFWSMLGVALIVRRGFSVQGAAAEAEKAIAEVSAGQNELPRLPAGESG